ncbi:hypothetical protein ABT373_25635 [Streptomyces sp. NPDC000070]|uniref:hypothetical protein n=1 Tax=Streptomyces sp. NPDC000070 TaxID=3154240 RepID=UPI0033214196
MPGDNLMLHAAIVRRRPAPGCRGLRGRRAVTPAARREEILAAARAKLAKEAEQSLDAWEADHRARIEKALSDQGFTG